MKRSSGILCHISSLPSTFGIGDLGPAAYAFVDFLVESGQSYWQILPLNPTDGINFHSPYSSFSAFGANTLFISPEKLIEQGLLSTEDLKNAPHFSSDQVDFEKVIAWKNGVFDKAFDQFQKNKALKKVFDDFVERNKYWCGDLSLFVILKKIHQGQAWTSWPEEYLKREKAALERIKKDHAKDLEKVLFLQFIFEQQWNELKEYCRGKGIKIIGDIPIYVTHDSADVWSHPGLFQLDENYDPILVAGVPPDYFSATGQRWGNPVYDWNELKETRFAWWIARFQRNFTLTDVVRIDHFRGLVKYWAIPAGEETAVNGSWEDIPTDEFLTAVMGHFGDNEVIAEDLGIITPDVVEIMERYELPGMKILLFAFNGDMKTHPYLPHNCPVNSVIYTGTHDNNTVRGWFEQEASAYEKENLANYCGHPIDSESASKDMINLALASPSELCIIPLQDVLALGQEARMNKPATTCHNWIWRLSSTEKLKAPQAQLKTSTQKFQRV